MEDFHSLMPECSSAESDISNRDMDDLPAEDQRALYDSDFMEEPDERVGDMIEICMPNKVTKEILRVGEGVRTPNNQFLCRCKYKMYFFDHTEIENTGDKVVEIVLNDKKWPEGLRMAIGKMRKNEKAKIKIKKSYGFGTTLDPELLKVPETCKDGEMNTRLKTKNIIYELELLDWDIRDDITNDGKLVKIVTKRSKSNMDKPNGIDEVTIDIKVYQTDDNGINTIFFEKKNWTVLMDHEDITATGTRVLETMREDEICTGIAKPEFYKEVDMDAIKKWGLQEHLDLKIDIHLMTYITIVDWYRDKKTLRRTIKRGYSRVPFYESTVLVRFRIEVNGDLKFNNFLEDDEMDIHQVNAREKRNLDKKRKELEKISRNEHLIEEPVTERKNELMEEIMKIEKGLEEVKYKYEPLKFTLYEYTLPSLISKVIKTMYKDEIGQIDTNKVDKLTNNFSSNFINKDWFRTEGENSTKILIHLVDFDQPEAFYKLPIEEKLSRIQAFKKIAMDFFKAESYKKSCKMFQKINGYYNFGDANNNFLKEDENSEHFKK